MLDLVISLTLVDLPRRLLSIQTRSKCSSPSGERIAERELQEKSVRAEQFPYGTSEIQTYHLQTKRKAIFHYLELLNKYHKDTLVLVHSLRSLVEQNLLRRNHFQQTYSKFRENPKTAEPQYIMVLVPQKTIWCCRISYSQSRQRQMLFSFTGADRKHYCKRSSGGLFRHREAGVLVRFAHTGGEQSLSVEMHILHAELVGFGTLRKLSGAAESLTFNPTERDMLFSFTGERIAERTTFRELGTTGKFTFSGTSGDPLLTFAEQPFVNIDVTGDSKDVRSRAYQGGGTLFSLNNVVDSFTRAPYQGSGSIRMSGNGFVQVQLFQPARVYVWII